MFKVGDYVGNGHDPGSIEQIQQVEGRAVYVFWLSYPTYPNLAGKLAEYRLGFYTGLYPYLALRTKDETTLLLLTVNSPPD